MLEARLRAASTQQRQLLRIRIVLEAAEARPHVRSRASWIPPRPRSACGGRFAREGSTETPGPAAFRAPPIYGEWTDKRIRSVLDQPPPAGFRPLERTTDRQGPGDVDVQYVWRSLRKQKIDLAAARAGARATIPSSPPRLLMWSASICATQECHRHLRRREAVDPSARARSGYLVRYDQGLDQILQRSCALAPAFRPRCGCPSNLVQSPGCACRRDHELSNTAYFLLRRPIPNRQVRRQLAPRLRARLDLAQGAPQ